MRERRLIGTALALPAVLALALVALTGGATTADGTTDLSLTKTDAPDPVVKNGTLTYTITVNNLGGTSGMSDAPNTTVTDVLSNDVDYKSSTASVGSCDHTGHTVTCTLGTLNELTSATATIVVKPTKAGTLSNTASVSTTVLDSALANNTATATTTVSDTPSTPGKGKKKGKGKASCANPTIVGTAGNDVLSGTKHSDVIAALAGNDIVFGAEGNDAICASGGRDRLFGGPGSDSLAGGSRRDRLFGGAGNDFLNGGRGRDKCRGGAGTDVKKSCP